MDMGCFHGLVHCGACMFSNWSFPGGLVVKNTPSSAGDIRDVGSIRESRRFNGGRKWQPTPVFLPGEFHGPRSLASYSPCGCRESDMTKRLSPHTNLYTNGNTHRYYECCGLTAIWPSPSPPPLLLRTFFSFSLSQLSPGIIPYSLCNKPIIP